MTGNRDTAGQVLLLVDDEVLIRTFLTDLLTDEGFKVLEAANAHEALRVLEAVPDVQVLVTDVNMPGGMNGLELAHVVKERWPNIIRIIISGRAVPATDELPAASKFLLKPCTALDIAEAIRGGSRELTR